MCTEERVSECSLASFSATCMGCQVQMYTSYVLHITPNFDRLLFMVPDNIGSIDPPQWRQTVLCGTTSSRRETKNNNNGTVF